MYLLPGYKLCLDNATDIYTDILFKVDMTILYPLITIIYAVFFFTSVYCISNVWVKLCIVNALALIFVVSMIFPYIMIMDSENDSKLFHGVLTTAYLLLSSIAIIVIFCLYQLFLSIHRVWGLCSDQPPIRR